MKNVAKLKWAAQFKKFSTSAPWTVESDDQIHCYNLHNISCRLWLCNTNGNIHIDCTQNGYKTMKSNHIKGLDNYLSIGLLLIEFFFSFYLKVIHHKINVFMVSAINYIHFFPYTTQTVCCYRWWKVAFVKNDPCCDSKRVWFDETDWMI